MLKPMIDIHVLTHKGTKAEWLAQCLASLEGHPVRVHVVEGVEGSVGAGRAKGYALGDCKYVGYIDSDDYVLDGHYDLCLKMLRHERSVVPYEYVEFLDGARSSKQKSFHNGAVYRRRDIMPLLSAMIAAPFTADMLTRKALKPYQMSHIGCVWRSYPNTASSMINKEVFIQESYDWNKALMGKGVSKND